LPYFEHEFHKLKQEKYAGHTYRLTCFLLTVIEETLSIRNLLPVEMSLGKEERALFFYFSGESEVLI
jgi:hypothetical protein